MHRSTMASEETSRPRKAPDSSVKTKVTSLLLSLVHSEKDDDLQRLPVEFGLMFDPCHSRSEGWNGDFPNKHKTDVIRDPVLLPKDSELRRVSTPRDENEYVKQTEQSSLHGFSNNSGSLASNINHSPSRLSLESAESHRHNSNGKVHDIRRPSPMNILDRSRRPKGQEYREKHKDQDEIKNRSSTCSPGKQESTNGVALLDSGEHHSACVTPNIVQESSKVAGCCKERRRQDKQVSQACDVRSPVLVRQKSEDGPEAKSAGLAKTDEKTKQRVLNAIRCQNPIVQRRTHGEEWKNSRPSGAVPGRNPHKDSMDDLSELLQDIVETQKRLKRHDKQRQLARSAVTNDCSVTPCECSKDHPANRPSRWDPLDFLEVENYALDTVQVPKSAISIGHYSRHLQADLCWRRVQAGKMSTLDPITALIYAGESELRNYYTDIQ